MAPKSDTDLSSLLTVRDFQPIAEKKLPENIYGYFANGADDELALARNASAYDQLLIVPRVLRDVTHVDTTTTLFGRKLAFPLLVAPSARHCLASSEGEMDTARAAVACGVGMGLSSESTTGMEDVISCRPRPADGALEDTFPGFFFQLYLTDDLERNKILVRRAEAAGYQGLVLTVDTPFLGNRLRERRSPVILKPPMCAENLKNLPPVPQSAPGEPTWLYQLLDARTAAQVESIRAKAGKGFPTAAVTWDHVAELRQMTKAAGMKLLLKGVVHPGDAELAVRIGADAIIVSNHGGRQLDSAPATIMSLPGIVNTVQGRIPVLVDGGIRRGSDIFKAVCLGATAVLVGRPILWGLTAGGQAGVEAVLHILEREFTRTMGLAGTLTVAELNKSFLCLERDGFAAAKL